MIALAIKGDVRAATFIADRTVGRPRQSVAFENSRPGVLTVEYVNDWRKKPLPGDPPPDPPGR
jgi:hypothetical protein